MHSRFESPEQRGTSVPVPVRVDRYLEELAEPLPVTEREEWRMEARQHLDALIAAHEELGASHEEAVAAALVSFGQARRIGTRVAREMDKGTVKPLVQAITEFAKPIFPGILLALIAVLGFAYTRDGEAYLNFLAPLSAILFVVNPILGGWNVGRKLPEHSPLRDLVLAPALGVICCLPHLLLLSAMRNHLTFILPADLSCWVLLWLPLAIGSACLSWQVRHRRKNAQRA